MDKLIKNIKIIGLDFDDTISMTEESCFRMENYAASKLRFGPQERNVHLKTWGLPVEIAAAKRFPGINTRAFKLALDEVMPSFIKQGKVDNITEENYRTLKELKAMGKKLIIVTSRTEAEVRHLLNKNHPLSLHIDAFYHADNSDFLKPDPRVFEKMLLEFKVKPNQTMYVGDSLGDAKSANAAGLLFVASLESGLKTRENFKDARVDYFIQKFSDLLTLFIE